MLGENNISVMLEENNISSHVSREQYFSHVGREQYFSLVRREKKNGTDEKKALNHLLAASEARMFLSEASDGGANPQEASVGAHFTLHLLLILSLVCFLQVQK